MLETWLGLPSRTALGQPSSSSSSSGLINQSPIQQADKTSKRRGPQRSEGRQGTRDCAGASTTLRMLSQPCPLVDDVFAPFSSSLEAIFGFEQHYPVRLTRALVEELTKNLAALPEGFGRLFDSSPEAD